MKPIWQWLFRDGQTYDGRSVIRIAKRIVYLFVIFNLLYYLIQPLEIGYPTLYNGIFPGRIRMEWTPGGFESLGINELKLSRLLADHVISRPKGQDEYRIVFLGSSEIWGYFNRPQDTMPIIVDEMGLTTPDGRLVRSYNLSYVYANAIKDMLILDYVLSHGNFDPDLIVWVNIPSTVWPNSDPHWLEMANPELTVEMAQQYGLTSPALDQVGATLDVPWWRRHSFLSERDDIAYWLLNEFYGLAWTSTGEDVQFPSEATLDEAPETFSDWNIRQPGALEAMVAMTRDYDVPLLLVVAPMAAEAPQYHRWLTERSETLSVPMLDCSEMLPDRYFTDVVVHINAEGHRLFAEGVAAWLRMGWATPLSEMNMITLCPTHN